MKDGQITQSGSYEELLTAGTAFEQLVNAHRDVITGLGPSNDETQEETQKLDTVQLEMSQGSSFTNENSEGEIAVNGLPGVQLTEEEETEINDVGWNLEAMLGLYHCLRRIASSLLRHSNSVWFCCSSGCCNLLASSGDSNS